MRSRLSGLLPALSLLFLFGLAGFGQEFRATLTGRVTDPSGAGIPTRRFKFGTQARTNSLPPKPIVKVAIPFRSLSPELTVLPRRCRDSRRSIRRNLTVERGAKRRPSILRLR